MNFRIAVVQFKIAHLDRATNLERIEAFIRKAVRKQAQVIVFPEDCMTGSIFGDVSKLDTTWQAKAAFRMLARKYRIDIITGSSMEGAREGNFNTSYYIDASGEVLGTYRKNHLYPSEYAFLQPGTEAPVFDTAYGRAGIVICWDMLFPEIFQRMKDQRVEIIYCPSYWFREVAGPLAKYNPRSEENQLDALCVARALETNCAVVYANAAGVQRYSDGTKDTLIGHSQIVMPLLGPIHRIAHNRECLFVEELDVDFLRRTSEVYQTEV